MAKPIADTRWSMSENFAYAVRREDLKRASEELSRLTTQETRAREALTMCAAALRRVKPQAQGALVVQDIDDAIAMAEGWLK